MKESDKLKRWSDDETNFLKENYKIYTIKELSLILDRTPKAIRGKLWYLGISLEELNRVEIYDWTEKEIMFLQENYKNMTDREIAKILFNEDDDKAMQRVFRKRTSLNLEKDERGLNYNHNANYNYVSRYYNGEKFFEHRENAEEKIGRKLKKGEIVHHINGDKKDNSFENLCVLIDKKEHKLIHCQLEKVAMELIKLGIIKFDEEKKEYYINKDLL